MTPASDLPSRSVRGNVPISFRARIKEIDMFFEKRDEVHKSMRRLVKRLEKHGIAYAIVGAMAVNAHKYVRTTKDVDVLLTPEGFAAFRRLFVPKRYDHQPGRPRRFTDLKNQVGIDVLVTGLFPGSGKPGPVAFPDPTAVGQLIEGVQVISLESLLQLKLAARRYQDFADVVHLIDTHNLEESYLDRLDASVHKDFIECLEEKRREDEYEARP